MILYHIILYIILAQVSYQCIDGYIFSFFSLDFSFFDTVTKYLASVPLIGVGLNIVKPGFNPVIVNLFFSVFLIFIIPFLDIDTWESDLVTISVCVDSNISSTISLLLLASKLMGAINNPKISAFPNLNVVLFIDI